MSSKEHESGSDRIAEAAAQLEVDIIVNVQGDEPFVKKEPLKKFICLRRMCQYRFTRSQPFSKQ